MRTTLLACTIVAAVGLTSCTGADAPPAQPRSTSSTGTTGTTGTSAGEPPLRLDGTRGTGCASLRAGREYTAWEHVLEPDADITLTGWSLRGAEYVTAGRGFVAAVPREVGSTGFTIGFPPGRDVVGSRNVDWAGRRDAEGATLEAGSRSNFWVRIKVSDGVQAAGYRGLTLHYTSGGEKFTARSDDRMRFRSRCA